MSPYYTQCNLKNPKSYQQECDPFTPRYITTKQTTYLYGPDPPHPRLFYPLPEIQKDPESWTIPSKINLGRPIVCNCDSESYQIAEYIDHHLKLLSTKHPSYVKDTYEFVNKLSNLTVLRKAFLFSVDIDSLMSKCPDKAVLQLLKITPTRNDFEFNGKQNRVNQKQLRRKWSI